MPVLHDDELDVRMGFDDLVKAGSGLGTACAIVMDDTVDMVEACENIAHFFADESCGQCTPCREGCHWMEKIFRRINAGRGHARPTSTCSSTSSPRSRGARSARWPTRPSGPLQVHPEEVPRRVRGQSRPRRRPRAAAARLAMSTA